MINIGKYSWKSCEKIQFLLNSDRIRGEYGQRRGFMLDKSVVEDVLTACLETGGDLQFKTPFVQPGYIGAPSLIIKELVVTVD